MSQRVNRALDWYVQQDGEPDVTILWQKTPVARISHQCGRCEGWIEPGTKYSSAGYIVDGKFEAVKTHLGAYQYPSGCPSIVEKEAAELAEQYARDKAEIFPAQPQSGKS